MPTVIIEKRWSSYVVVVEDKVFNTFNVFIDGRPLDDADAVIIDAITVKVSKDEVEITTIAGVLRELKD